MLYTELDDVGRRMLVDRSSRWPARPQAAALTAVRIAQEEAAAIARKKLLDWQAAAHRRQESERKAALAAQSRERQRLLRILNTLFREARRGPVQGNLANRVIGRAPVPFVEAGVPGFDLRPASAYRRMAEDILRGPVWQASRRLEAKDRIKLLGRLARQALGDKPASPRPPG